MPLRGESVGTAYVRLLADGSDVPDGIRDALRDAEPVVESEGEEHSKAYKKGFNKGLVKDNRKSINALTNNLAQGRGRLNGIAETMGGDFIERFRESVRDAVQDIDVADTILTKLENDFKRSGNRNVFFSALKNLPALQADAIRKLEATERRYIRDREAAFSEHHRRITDENDAEFEHIEETGTRAYNNLITGIERFTKTARGGHSERKRLHADLLVLLNATKAGGDETREYSEDLLEFQRRLNSANPRLDRFTRLINNTADRSSRLFGRGSRNNFLNFFGSLGRNLIRVTTIIPRAFGSLLTLGRSVSTAFTTAGGGMRGVISGLGALAAGMSGFAAAAASGVIAVGALLAVLIPLSVVISALTALVLALAASLTFSLAAGLGAVIGLLAPLSAGLGVAVAGFLALDDAQKKALKNDLKPLTNAFSSLADVAADGIFANVREQARLLAPVIQGLEPMFRRVSVAISDVGDAWIEMLRSDGFNNFRDEFAVVLPGMVRRLGRIFAQTLGGIGGIFVALIPTIQQFLGFLDRVTGNFSDWANSEAGRREIVRFFEDAAESASHVKDFLGEITGLLAALFTSGRESGDSLFQSMADNAERLTDHIKENPDAVQGWFEDAADLAREFGKATIEAGKLIDKLDSPEARETFRILIRLVGLTAQGLGIAAGAAGVLTARLQMMWGAIETGAGIARRIGQFISGQFQAMVNRIRPIVNMIPGILTQAGASAAARLAGAVVRMVGHIQTFIGRARGIIQALPGVFQTAAAMAAVRIAAAVDRMIGYVRGIPGRAAGAMAGLTAALVAPFNNALDQIRDIPDDIVGMFTGLAGDILGAIGRIDIGSLIDIPSPGGGVPYVPGIASGGIFEGRRGPGLLRRIGEDGPEAVVPLRRDLSRVDASVRMLSAIAQGLVPGMAGGGTVGVGKTINADNWTIVSPGADPRAVAHEVLNELVATGY